MSNVGSVSNICLFFVLFCFSFKSVPKIDGTAKHGIGTCNTVWTCIPLHVQHLSLCEGHAMCCQTDPIFYITALHSNAVLECIACTMLQLTFQPAFLAPFLSLFPLCFASLCPGRTAHHSYYITCFSLWRGSAGLNSNKKAADHSLTQSCPGQTYHNTPFITLFSLGVGQVQMVTDMRLPGRFQMWQAAGFV